MKSRSKKSVVISLIVSLAVIITLFCAVMHFSGLVMNKSYYQNKLNSIVLPESCKTISVSVKKSDIYGIHVCAEKIISTPLTYNELDLYMQNHNVVNSYELFNIYKNNGSYEVDWDDYCIDINILSKCEKSNLNYYIVSCNTPYGSIVY